MKTEAPYRNRPEELNGMRMAPVRPLRPVKTSILMPDGAKLTIELPPGEHADNVLRAALGAFGMVGNLR